MSVSNDVGAPTKVSTSKALATKSPKVQDRTGHTAGAESVRLHVSAQARKPRRMHWHEIVVS
eukprot:6209556-Pleurochrysis_carterae.AAC.5